MSNPTIPGALKPDDEEKIITKMIEDKNFRLQLTTKSHYWFFHCYLKHYVKSASADMHRDMLQLTESDEKITVVLAFRGCGKSTLFTLSYPLWAILGEQQKKFVVILSQTQRQARQHLMNIKSELEHNDLLRRDLGPFREETDEWGGYSLVLSKYDARIAAASTEQSIRGIRHLQFRPDLIIGDDLEDLQSVKTREGRDKTHRWLTGDVLPAGEPEKTKIVLLGTKLNDDSAIMRFVRNIERGKTPGIAKTYPLIDERGKILWPDRYPNKEAVEAERMKLNDDVAWHREYLLELLPEAENVIHQKWIKYHAKIPSYDAGDYHRTYLAVDPAISERDTADYTAMVMASAFGSGDNLKIYIHPNPVNERLTFNETKERALAIARNLAKGRTAWVVIEDNAYQKALYEETDRCSGIVNVEAFKVNGMDKRSRLSAAGSAIQAGKVFFAEVGNEKLIQQLVNFPAELHDDLADAFAMAILKILENDSKGPMLTVWSVPMRRRGLADW